MRVSHVRLPPPFSRRRVGRVADKKITRRREAFTGQPRQRWLGNVTFQPSLSLRACKTQTRVSQNALPRECKLLDKEHNAVTFLPPSLFSTMLPQPWIWNHIRQKPTRFSKSSRTILPSFTSNYTLQYLARCKERLQRVANDRGLRV